MSWRSRPISASASPSAIDPARRGRAEPLPLAPMLSRTPLGRRPARFGRGLHFIEPSGPDVVDIAIDRHVCGHQGMLANATHVLGDAVSLVLDRMPFDEVAGRVTPVVVRVRPGLAVEARGRKIVLEQIGDYLVGEKLHAAIRVMNDKPFLRAEELVGNDKRPYGVVGRTAARVADDMRV